ncbi:EAL domain-containing protein [Pseudohaliea sp.]|uniref:EAL domain-containing protein n=1 Tax=Pseudohaliea sp. TaxID=2740289 RepID=UPI0032F085F0
MMKLLRPTIALLPLGCLLGALVLYSTLVLEVREAYRAGPGTVSVAYGYRPGSAPMTPEQALATGFTPVNATGQRTRPDQRQQWYRVALENRSAKPADLVLAADNPLADRITVHVLAPEGGTRQLKSLGEDALGLGAVERALPQWGFSLAPGERQTLLVHFETSGSTLFPLAIMSAEQFQRFTQLRNMSHGAFAGILLLVACCSGLLSLWIRDPAYLSFAGYGVLVLASFGVTTGFLHFALPTPLALFLSREIVFLNGLLIVAALEFALFFLRFDIENRKVYRRAQCYALFVLAGALASIPAPEYLSGVAFTAVHLVSYSWIFVLLAFRFRERFRWTRYYLLSWIPFFTSTALVSAMFQGLIAYDVLLRFAPMAAVTLELVFMAAALGERLAMLERKRLHAATHDEQLGLPTARRVEQRLASILASSGAGPIHLLAVEVSNYHAVTPFLTGTQLRAVMLGLADWLRRSLQEAVELVPLERVDGTTLYAGLPQREILTLVLRSSSATAARAAVEALSREGNFNTVQHSVPYRVECRFGLAAAPPAGEAGGNLLSESRIALARAAELGLNCWVFSTEDVARGQRKVRLAQDLDQALTANALMLYHQPQFSIDSPASIQSEVLLRWEHPNLGFIDPAELIAIAEQTGLITRLTRWVIGESMRHCGLIRERHGDRCRIALNLSAHDFIGEELLTSLQAGLKKYDLTPELFTLEMTESVRLAISPATRETIRALRALGFRIAIDDFGTGYAAMSYALNHPVDEIKIDQTFMREFPDNARVVTVVGSILTMASELQIAVTVEGVEESRQARRLASMGCNHLQGYGYARPMTFSAYLEWLEQEAPQAAALLLGENRTA